MVLQFCSLVLIELSVTCFKFLFLVSRFQSWAKRVARISLEN